MRKSGSNDSRATEYDIVKVAYGVVRLFYYRSIITKVANVETSQNVHVLLLARFYLFCWGSKHFCILLISQYNGIFFFQLS